MTGYQTPSDQYLKRLREVYVPAVNEPEPWRAVRWGSEELQSKRLDVLSQYVERNQTVLDVGCGRGEFATYVEVDYPMSWYLGIDIVEEFIPVAKLINRNPKVDFECHDLRDKPRPADAVVASGLFTISNDEIFWSMLDAMWGSARRLMAFNCKSTWAPDLEKNDLKNSYLRDPAETLAACRERYSSKIVLRHDYLDHDFTIAVWK